MPLAGAVHHITVTLTGGAGNDIFTYAAVGDSGTTSQVDVAARLGITPNALGVSVHRLRRRFGELLREEVSQTVSGPADIDDELRHLLAALGS